MSIADDVRRVQTWYPHIYLACHTDHKRARSTKSGITPRESSLLAHLDERTPQSAAALARHLRIGRPAMSAMLKRLHVRGLVRVDRDARDARRLEVRLTRAGTHAMAEASVLETALVRKLLQQLSPPRRRHALSGLQLLAEAARGLARESA